jgi:hypothetical protein
LERRKQFRSIGFPERRFAQPHSQLPCTRQLSTSQH